jgi:hypothetical protein
MLKGRTKFQMVLSRHIPSHQYYSWQKITIHSLVVTFRRPKTLKMSVDKYVICRAKGTIKYDGFSHNKKGWLSGSIVLWKDPDRKDVRLNMLYDANPKAGVPSIKVSLYHICEPSHQTG